MNSILVKAVAVVTLALIFYSIAVITEQRKHRITRLVLTFLTLGVLLDITSTVLMIIGSSKIPLTVHGIIGYTALLAMLIETILIWRSWRRSGGTGEVSRGVNLYTRLAYLWWIIAYIAGGIIAMLIK